MLNFGNVIEARGVIEERESTALAARFRSSETRSMSPIEHRQGRMTRASRKHEDDVRVMQPSVLRIASHRA
jgi:hypothetical protein